MAIFNETYLVELGVSWHGHTHFTKEEKSDPKFRKDQYKKVMKVIHDLFSSIEFSKNFTSIPTVCEYSDSDDDAQYCLGRWIAGHDKVLGIASFSREDYESGAYRDSADYLIKGFESAKKKDPKLFGHLICTGKYDASIDYKI